MSERYPYPLPESTIASIEKNRTPVWKRYYPAEERRDGCDPVGLEALDWWKFACEGQIEALEHILRDMQSDGSTHPQGEVFQHVPVFGIFTALRALLNDFDELLLFIKAVIPHDPEIQKLVAEGWHAAPKPKLLVNHGS
jgi:hypothetical protein